MPRSLALAFPSFAFAAALGLLSSAGTGCTGADHGTTEQLDAGMRRDSAPVEEADGGAPPPDPIPAPEPSCETYCGLVMANCTGDDAQYASTEDCLALCAHLPLTGPSQGGEGEKQAASVACRQYWANSPSRANPKAYCLAAGPFGAGTCGDRCTAFCQVTLSACAADAGRSPPYETQPECASACTMFPYRDDDEEGGGEGPEGPSAGDTLNCRLFWLRHATRAAESCEALRPTSEACTREASADAEDHRRR